MTATPSAVAKLAAEAGTLEIKREYLAESIYFLPAAAPEVVLERPVKVIEHLHHLAKVLAPDAEVGTEERKYFKRHAEEYLSLGKRIDHELLPALRQIRQGRILNERDISSQLIELVPPQLLEAGDDTSQRKIYAAHVRQVVKHGESFIPYFEEMKALVNSADVQKEIQKLCDVKAAPPPVGPASEKVVKSPRNGGMSRGGSTSPKE